MFIIHVHVHVKPEFINQFIEATLDNARNSVQEPGVARFDVVQQSEDATRFVLLEAYRNPAALDQHRTTAHFARWRDAVGEMMAEERTRVQFSNVFPGDEAW